MSQQNTWHPYADIQLLKLRAKLYADIRAFMQARDTLEVDTPILSRHGITDPFIEQVKAYASLTKLPDLYLHTSPEYCMKRLLAAGVGDCFQIAHVFRDGEQGARHTLEFMMLEWYRLGFNYLQLMDEVVALIEYLGWDKPVKQTYVDVFESTLNINPLTIETNALKQISIDNGWAEASSERHELLDYLFSHLVIKQIKNPKSLIIYEYPACMASLSKINEQNPAICERFELFINGIEIANGFTELTNAEEQRQRFIEEQALRNKQGRSCPPIDELFLSSLESGLAECSGVAVGLDRLLMVLTDKQHINEVQSFTLDNN